MRGRCTCRAGTNLNYLLEEYGLSAAPDCAIQSAFRKCVCSWGGMVCGRAGGQGELLAC